MIQGALMLDLAGVELDPEEAELLQHPAVGGVIFFSRNYVDPQQIQELSRQIRQHRPDLLQAVDQEGGRVQRFSAGLTPLPAMGVLGDYFRSAAAKAEEAAQAIGWLMAAELLALGLDISFAPVLDLNPGVSEIIGQRAVSADPQIAISILGAYISGMQRAGMAATGKHFPGHGSVALDSHLALPVDERPWSTIEQYDLRTFAALMDQLQGIMPAHVTYPAIAPEPAGFSAFWLQEILRRQMGFAGLIFSDDLSMAGAAGLGSYADRAQAALAAGCDMVLVCNQRDAAVQVLEYLEKAIKDTHPWRRTALLGKPRHPWKTLKNRPEYTEAMQWLDRLGQR